MIPTLAIFLIDDLLIWAAITAVAMAIQIGFKLLTKQDAPKNPLDKTPPTLATRGSYIPIILGRRRVGPVVCWAGARVVYAIPVGGGGGLSGGESVSQNGYAEAAMHALCVGRANKLHGIFINGHQIYSTILDRDTTPSGTSIGIPKQGRFTIWWGEPDQPVNTELAASGQMGISSRWPNVCYIHWNLKALGQTVRWPQIEYEIEVGQADQPLTHSDPFMDVSEVDVGDDGYNPAHVAWQLMTASAPHGAGLDGSLIDGDRMEYLGTVAQAEHTPVSVTAENGRTCDDLLTSLFTEMLWSMPQQGDLLRPHAIRGITDLTLIPTLDHRLIVGSLTPTEPQQSGPLLPDRISFVINDRGISYKPFSIFLPDDANMINGRATKRRQEQIDTVIDRKTGYFVALRRNLDLATPAHGFKFKVQREARLMMPGQAFVLDGVGVLRVSAIQDDLRACEAQIDAVLDVYTYDLGTFRPDDVTSGYGSGGNLDPVPDVLVVPFMLPTSVAPGGAADYFGVARVRGNQQIVSARVTTSVSGAAYLDQGPQDAPAAGGTLNSPIPDGTGDIAFGPSITSFNTDIQAVLDLTSNLDEWANGRQICIIDDECFYLERVTAISGGWQLEGMKRAKYGTTHAAHAVNAKVVIFDAQTITPIRAPATGTTIYIKTIPSTNTSAVDPSSVTAVPLVVP